MSARVSTSLQINQGNLNYQSQPGAFVPTITFANGPNGPTPGTVTISVNGTDITFSQLTAMGGLCRLMNLDPTSTICVGARDKTSNEFYPVMDLKPGENFIIRLSADLGKEELGTGTFSGSNSVFHCKAVGANANMQVDAFDP